MSKGIDAPSIHPADVDGQVVQAALDFVHNVEHSNVAGFGDACADVRVDASFQQLREAVQTLIKVEREWMPRCFRCGQSGARRAVVWGDDGHVYHAECYEEVEKRENVHD